jgi:hypothetical protein
LVPFVVAEGILMGGGKCMEFGQKWRRKEFENLWLGGNVE